MSYPSPAAPNATEVILRLPAEVLSELEGMVLDTSLGQNRVRPGERMDETCAEPSDIASYLIPYR